MNEKECLNNGGIWVNNVCYSNNWEELHEEFSNYEVNNNYSNSNNNDNNYFICFILLFIVVFSLLIFLIKKSKLFS